MKKELVINKVEQVIKYIKSLENYGCSNCSYEEICAREPENGPITSKEIKCDVKAIKELENIIEAISEEESKSKESLFKTIDGSYFTPNKYCIYERWKDIDGTPYYLVTIVCGQGAGFNRKITEEDMNKILEESEKK